MQRNGSTTEIFLENILVHSHVSKFFSSFVWVFLYDKSFQSFFSIKTSASLYTSVLKLFSKVLCNVAGFRFSLLNLNLSVSEMFNLGFLIWLFIWFALKALPTLDFNLLWSDDLFHYPSLILNIGLTNILYFLWLHFLITVLLYLIQQFFHS